MLKKNVRANNYIDHPVFSESILKRSFYEELQKNGWCQIVDDRPRKLSEIVKIRIKGK
ncbi:hypothetical protein JW813_03185 [Clostridium botulinum]|uniref:hypothetical protein n=1 Tax=Clostridium botulinum TaxID=1491 RepID=UPI002248676E|nr:hypothetical protein [Clostridium botulinum]UZP04017.1 hypothetical protein JW813_03185 [Clostridium botulinum]UZP07373.1 hypothetical protein JYA71_03180 [Clostridium botulinum]UZP10755.1 hypothetical protein JYA74_03180 [Clostridium botulinum]